LIYATVTSIVTADFATLGGSSDETIKVGHTLEGAGFERVGRLNLVDLPRYLRMVPADVGSPSAGNVEGMFVLFSSKTLSVEQIMHGAGADFNITVAA
jgi:hypothetical protein